MQSLINSRPEATTALLMQLCTDMGDASKADSEWVAKIGDFAHLYTNRSSPAHTLLLSAISDIVQRQQPFRAECAYYALCNS